MKRAVCCFCGKSEEMRNLISIIIMLNQDNEQQYLMCHKKCIAERLHEDVMLHPDLKDSLNEITSEKFD